MLLHRAALQWRRSLEILQQDAVKLQHFLEIQYEDLLDNPTATTAKIFNFLNLKPINAEELTPNQSLQTLAYQETKHLAQMTAEQRVLIKSTLGKNLSIK